MIKKYRIYSALFYYISFVFAVFFFGSNIKNTGINHIVRPVWAVLMMVFAHIGSYIRCKNHKTEESRKIMLCTFKVMLAVYFCAVLELTLFDGTFGRNITVFFTASREQRIDYIKYRTNFIPFKTFMIFINGYNRRLLSFSDIFINIIGNLAVFMPFALLLPPVFKKARKAYVFALFCASAIIAIELLQFVFMTGSCDIDDFILNFSGAIIAFYLLKIRPIKESLNKITFGVF